jgi:hypothetical protein
MSPPHPPIKEKNHFFGRMYIVASKFGELLLNSSIGSRKQLN